MSLPDSETIAEQMSYDEVVAVLDREEDAQQELINADVCVGETEGPIPCPSPAPAGGGSDQKNRGSHRTSSADWFIPFWARAACCLELIEIRLSQLSPAKRRFAAWLMAWPKMQLRRVMHNSGCRMSVKAEAEFRDASRESNYLWRLFPKAGK